MLFKPSLCEGEPIRIKGDDCGPLNKINCFFRKVSHSHPHYCHELECEGWKTQTQAPEADRCDEAEVEQSVMFIKSKNRTEGHKVTQSKSKKLRETHKTGERKQLGNWKQLKLIKGRCKTLYCQNKTGSNLNRTSNTDEDSARCRKTQKVRHAKH